MTFSSHRPKFTAIFFVICSRQSISIVLQPIRRRTTRIAAPVWWLSKDFPERRKPAQILDFGIFLFPHLLLKMFPIKWTFAGHLRVSILQVYFLESRCRFNSLQNTNSGWHIHLIIEEGTSQEILWYHQIIFVYFRRLLLRKYNIRIVQINTQAMASKQEFIQTEPACNLQVIAGTGHSIYIKSLL